MSRQGRGHAVRVIIIVIVLLAAVGAVLFGVFQVRSVETVGNSRYSAEQITADLLYDIPTKNTLYLGWKYRHAVSDSRAPYLTSIQAKILSPGRIRLIVQEKTLLGYVQYEGNNVCFDQDGVVLEITDQIYQDTVLIEGVPMQQPELYKKLPVENTAQLRTMLSIARLLKESGLEVSSISFDENQNITARIGTIEVQLGQDEYLEEKVSNLTAIYRLQEGQTGVLNMSAYTGKNEPITFSNPETEPVTEEAPEESGEASEGADADQAAQPSGEEPSGTDGAEDTSAPEESGGEETTGLSAFMVFDSSGTLRYDAHVVGGQVLDAYGNPIDGCYVNEDGNVVDAYWNVIDPYTGTLAE